MLKLKRPTTGETFDFPPGSDVLTIGRAASNRIVIDDPHVSALHGQISCLAEGYRYQDLRSTNGSAVERAGNRTTVDSVRVPSFLLQEGDRILLGSQTDPVILEVVGCRRPERSPPKAITVVAAQRLAPVGEVGGRIESGGGSLLPFLSFAESLARASIPEEAFEMLGDCLGEVVEAISAVAVLEPFPSATQTIWSRPTPIDLGESEPTAQLFSEEPSVVVTQAGSGQRAWIPLETDIAPARWVVLECGRQPTATDLDSLSLAAKLLGARLRQLNLVSQLEAARSKLSAKNRYLREKAEQRAGDALVGKSPAMRSLREQIRQVALSDATVLVAGPSGSGKELVAREIHRLSLRHAEIFAAVNCGALVDSLLETELFGCLRGAFTGAHRDREGLFEVAHGGTLFLDEIGDMSPALQVKLLRVLETREVVPVGGTRPRRVDVRVITATHRDLEAEVAAGRFREDLFYRLHVFPIRVPPLLERREDIPLLARHFLKSFAASTGQQVYDISEEAMRVLLARDFPGNVRQLANEIQRAVLLASEKERIQPEHLTPVKPAEPATHAIQTAKPVTLKEQMNAVEKTLIEEALKRCGGNRTHTARLLGITRQALLLKLNRHRTGGERKPD